MTTSTHIVLLTGAELSEKPLNHEIRPQQLVEGFHEISPELLVHQILKESSALSDFVRVNCNYETMRPVLLSRTRQILEKRSKCLIRGFATIDLPALFDKKRDSLMFLSITEDLESDELVGIGDAFVATLGAWDEIGNFELEFDPITSFDQKPIQDSYSGEAHELASWLKFRQADPERQAIAIQTSLVLAESSIMYAQFCGMQAVSLRRDDLQHMPLRKYTASPKLNGTRCFMMSDETSLYLMDRALHVWVCDWPGHPPMGSYFLVDVEMVRGPNGPLLFVLDTIASGGECVRGLRLFERLGAFRTIVGQCRFPEPVAKCINEQSYFKMSQMGDLMNLCSTTPIPIDGVIFTPVHKTYRLGSSHLLYKWKPREKNTLDLLYSKEALWAPDLAGEMQKIADVIEADRGNAPDGCIAECALGNDGLLHPIGVRDDKRQPNPLTIVQNVIENVKENITVEELMRTLCH